MFIHVGWLFSVVVSASPVIISHFPITLFVLSTTVARFHKIIISSTLVIIATHAHPITVIPWYFSMPSRCCIACCYFDGHCYYVILDQFLLPTEYWEFYYYFFLSLTCYLNIPFFTRPSLLPVSHLDKLSNFSSCCYYFGFSFPIHDMFYCQV